MSKPTPDGLPFAEVPNDQVASSARQFREAADFLYARLTEHNCVSPLLMVAAFGIELFLKCLNAECVYHVYHQDEGGLAAFDGYRVTAEPLKKGHPLVSLLDPIDDRFRKGLEDAYAAKPVIRGKATLRDALAEYDTLFVSARYPFEDGNDGGGRSITGLVELLDLIADHVGTLPRQVFPPERSGS
jgi:hypothetical protein